MPSTCTAIDCTRTVLARGLCAPHYSTWHRAQKKYTIECGECGKTVAVGRKTMKYCSTLCANTANNRLAVAKVRALRQPTINQCAWCYAMVLDSTKYCGSDCRESAAVAHAKSRRSPLRAAFEDGDSAEFLRLVRERSTVHGSGCWMWDGALSRDGYPTHRVGKREVAIHRAVIEATLGQPLGSQHAHHQCANTQCVNPDHLQPVTHRDNAAEMLARHSYLARIAELESALAEVAPGHALLTVIRVA